MSETDDNFRRTLKELILKMVSYSPHLRPKITEVYKCLQKLMGKGDSTKVSIAYNISVNFVQFVCLWSQNQYLN